ncbi:hypothetical protein SEA_MINIFLAYER_7 [Satellite phage MiniFlayer]|nr:hypothetical protein SEA_MINIFLAYER_7 [Satellite phage MiniFlayer]
MNTVIEVTPMIGGMNILAKTVKVVAEVAAILPRVVVTSILRAITSFGGTSVNAVSPSYSFMNGGVAVA